MEYYCRDCSYRGNTSGQLGECPACGSFNMGKRKPKRRSFTQEFKTEVVGLCRRGDRSVGHVARDLDLTESAVRAWVQQDDVDRGHGPPGELTSDERMELRRLRRENRRLREEREIPKKAAAFFAKEST